MATKKSGTPVPEEPVKDKELEEEAGKLEKMAQQADAVSKMRAELEQLKKENEKLRQNSVAAYGLAGAKSDYERVKEACEKAAKEGRDAWQEKISIRAPRRPAKEDPFYWLSVNGQTMQVPANDKYFELALPYADALVNMIAAEWFANDFADSIEEYDPVTNPHRE